MMNYLKFTLVFILELIQTNIIKTIFLTAAIITFIYAGTFEDDVNSYDVATVVKVDSNYIYVFRIIHDGQIKYENIWNEKEIPIKDGKIYISSYSFANGFMWVVFGISSLILIIGTIIGRDDDDIGWEIGECWDEAFSTLIYCQEENGEFYYLALGRLISKRDRPVSRSYHITSELKINGFRELYRCPKYQTKTQRRETLLNKIGIN